MSSSFPICHAQISKGNNNSDFGIHHSQAGVPIFTIKVDNMDFFFFRFFKIKYNLNWVPPFKFKC